tara:strand:+ start:57 stop:488 length:432 start_codon:yes stop_codon:yes gene_type:complete
MVNKIEKEENIIVKAIGKNLKSSPQKANIVLGLIRGIKVEQAINNLEFSKRRISNEILKILKSAISNAENNHQLDIDKLFVKEASVGKSMVLKRFRPRARGRAGKILKTFSRVRILVQEKEAVEKKDKKVNNKIKKEEDGTKN